jgi:hypothetical protein
VNYVDKSISAGRGWAVASWTITLIAAVFGLVSNQAVLLFQTHFIGPPPSTSVNRITEAPELAASGKFYLPLSDQISTLQLAPLAVTTSQNIIPLQIRRAERFHRLEKNRLSSTDARRLLRGLAMLGVSPHYNGD